MFIYLSKKIKVAVPNPVLLNCIGWNREHGWIAVGGLDGLLKVLKLEGPGDKDKGGALNNLTMNQTLEGHNGVIEVITWNEHYRKLTTSDQYGLIIVWMLYKGQWFEEMINNRNKSVVRDMKWTPDGQKICIVYEDGAVIVGGVDGNRIWGKELRLPLTHVEWSPDCKSIVFGTTNGEVHIFDPNGNPASRVAMACLEGVSGPAYLAGIDWYTGIRGYVEPGCPSLAICYQNGRAQLMRHPADDKPVLLDTMMNITVAQWNDTGSVLAIAGTQPGPNNDERVNVIQFYNPFGDNLRTLKVPGKQLASIAWEGGGLRLALAVDHFIFFANVRPDYRWAFFSTTAVYAFSKPERTEHCVVFWETRLASRYVKYVKNLLSICASGEHCILCTKADDNSGQYVLILCNAIGTPLDSKYIDIEPLFVEMTPTHVVAASRSCVYVWNYKTTKHVDASKKSKRDDRIFHVDDAAGAKDDVTKFKKAKLETEDSISCVTISDRTIMVGRESGVLQQYALPRVTLEMKHTVNCRPDRISLNCTSSRLAIIDISGVLTFYDVEKKKVNIETGEVQYGEMVQGMERKDVWDMRWSDDDPDLFAMMERTTMYIFRDLDPEEPLNGNGYICSFKDLQIQSIDLDNIMKDPEHPTKESFSQIDIRSLRDTRVLLDKVALSDVLSFVEENPHPRLWRLLAEAALGKLDFNIAELSFVRCADFQGLELVKRLTAKIDDPRRQKAEVHIYFKQFEEAERIYLEMDRRDLAIHMRVKLGDWFRVVNLIKQGAGGDDAMLRSGWNSIGDYYADRQRWDTAVSFYEKGGNTERLADCYYRLEEYGKLEQVVHGLPEQDPLLAEIAHMFALVGLCKQAVDAFNRAGMIKEAIDVCVSLNQWDLGIQLAKQHNNPEIDKLLAKYAGHLLSKHKLLDAIELYRKANHHLDSAKLLFQLAAETADTKTNPLRAKKLYVLAALQVEHHREASKGSDPTRGVLDTLLGDASASQAQSRMIDTAWRGAEAFHFFLLAQRQLYGGQYPAALKTAVKLGDYDDILDPLQTSSILALAAVACQAYSLCSKAFIKLESLETMTPKQRESYEALALQIFTHHTPKDARAGHMTCNQCRQTIPDWSTSCMHCNAVFLPSVVTGRPMTDVEFWICGTCKHRASESEITPLKTCPLCHSLV